MTPNTPSSPASAGANPSAVPAHALWVELATRITTQRLHYRSGDEETAVESIHSLFATTRRLMTEHPDAKVFEEYALKLLNDALRPYTARWHGWMTEDHDRPLRDGKPVLRFTDEWVRRKFREELVQLQPLLFGYQLVFKEISERGEVSTPWWDAKGDPQRLEILRQRCHPPRGSANLGGKIEFVWRDQVRLHRVTPEGRMDSGSPPHAPEADCLIGTEMAAYERNAILERRRRLGLPEETPADGSPPAADGDATGIGLSGGGIRSATFCLGIAQTLQRRGLFHQFDYLSTVSGGGYLGSFISSYLGATREALETTEIRIEKERGDPVDGQHPAPFNGGGTPVSWRQTLDEAFLPQDESESEAPAVRHLRNNSRYLLNGGTWGLVRIVGLMLTGFFTSLLMLLTLPLAAAWILFGLKAHRTQEFFVAHPWLLAPWQSVWYGPITGGILLVSMALSWQEHLSAPHAVSPREGEAASPPKKRKLFGRAEPEIPSAPPEAGVAEPEISADATGKDDRPWWRKALVLLSILSAAIWLASVIRLGGWLIVDGMGAELRAQWEHPSAVAVAGAAGLLLLLWLIMPLAQRVAEGTQWNSRAAQFRSVMEAITLAVAVIAAGTLLVYLANPLVTAYEEMHARLQNSVQWLVAWKPPQFFTTAVLSIVPIIFSTVVKRKNGSVRRWAQVLFQLSSAVFFLTAFLFFAANLGVGRLSYDPSLSNQQPRWHPRVALIVTSILFFWVVGCINVNTFALHRYYRNRLCECYLAMKNWQQRGWLRRTLDYWLHGVPDPGATERYAGVGTLQRLPLSALGASPAAPYHLLNATINAAASKNPSLRGRNGDFFVFSRAYCGSPLTGYMTTRDLEKVDPHLDLGTAMAISGAAASTNMGWQTIRQLRFLLTLFNIRLGYWIMRPGRNRIGPSWWLLRIFEGPGVGYFLRELTGGVKETTKYVNLSDGGHIENLAVYELLRRQCKFIVCVDAGMEPKMECADLMRLQRYAAIDFGIRMHFDPADLTILPTSYSRAYAVLVKIDYAPTEEPADPGKAKLGWMLYVKLAVTGTEPRYVLDYRRQNPAFPHQTTGDQFYDEAQFEAYRALGEAAAESLFREEIIGARLSQKLEAADADAGSGKVRDLRTWFQALADNLLPDNDPAFER